MGVRVDLSRGLGNLTYYMKSLFLKSLLLLLWGAYFSACAPGGVEILSETDEKQYQLAQDYKVQGRMEDALSAFHRVIDARRDAPESHLGLGTFTCES